MAPLTPFPCSGHIYFSDESTLLTGGTAYVFNTTKGESTSCDINTAGEYMLDLGNLDTQWEEDDEVHIKAFSTDGRFGIVRFIIASGQGTFESDLIVDNASDMENLLEQRGENVVIKNVTVSTDDYGHTSTSSVDYLIYTIAEIISEVGETRELGGLQLGDLILLISTNDYNKKYAKIGNRVVYDSLTYKINEVIKTRSPNSGARWSHYEVFCRRES